ncbi:MAG: hypothetical protein IKJ55_08690 [Clostridia bacterium]|nr:hypothetical protein [Clostridia bacterium]
MKLSKSLIATVLVLCMLTAAMPVMGAVLNDEPITELSIPVEGLDITATNVGMNGQHWKIVINSNSVAAMGISHSYTTETWVNNNGPLNGSAYEGLVLSGTATMSSTDLAKVVDGAVVEFTFTKVPLSRVSYRASNGMSFGIDYAVLADRQYISNVKVWSAEAGAAVDYDGPLTKDSFKYNGSNYSSYTAPKNFRVDRGTWNGYIHYDTGVFPEGTIFVNALNLEKNALYVAADNPHETYNSITMRRNARGDFGIFIPKTSGSYYVYGLRHHYDADGSRTSKITITTAGIVDNVPTELSVDLTFSGNVGAKPETGVHSIFWCAPAGEVAPIKLTAGEPFLIRRNKVGTYDRLAGIAMVPAKADGSNPMLDVADSTWTYTNLPANNDVWNAWERLSVGKVDLSDSVTVTVNGVETVVPNMAARKLGYDAENQVLGWIKKTDLAGDIVTFPTVLDALVTATSPVEGNEDGYVPYDPVADEFSMGYCPADYSITLNGKLALRPSMLEIKDGDVIETVANNPSNFRPIMMETSADNGNGLVKDFIIYSLPQNRVQFGMRLDNFKTLGYVLTEEGNNATAFDNCIVSGYMYPRYTDVRWGATVADSNSPFYKESKIYFDAKVAYRGTNNNYGEPYYDIAAKERDEYKLVGTKEEALITVNGKTLHHPYIIANSGYTSFDYYGKKLYFCNNQTDTGLKVNKSAYTNRITLTTEATKLFTLFIVTYAEDGKTILNTRVINDQYVTWERGYSFTLNENQKAFVWGTKAYEGTNMQAICEPITLD